AEGEGFRGVQTAAHPAGRDDRQTRARTSGDRDGARHAPVAEDLAEPRARRVAAILRAHRLDRGERGAADPADVDRLHAEGAEPTRGLSADARAGLLRDDRHRAAPNKSADRGVETQSAS